MASKDAAAVEIAYKSVDLEPPLFVAGTFSEPPWTPVEMEHTKAASGENRFTKTILAKPGTAVQYKFRVGLSDWWVLDDAAPTVTDDIGNCNNLLTVVDHKSIGDQPPTPPPDSPTFRPADTGQPEALVTAPLPLSPAKGPVESLKAESQGPSRSGASTPSFVQTTIEVADSAAQIDPRTPEPEVSDREAGRTGYRRLSPTPIAQVADTAAEVADTAEALDEDVDLLEVDIGPEFSHERPGEEDNGQDEAPMFAYEVAGGRDRAVSMTESEYTPEPFPVAEKDDEADFDPQDPTLERFPSNREDILERVRTIETGLDEDVPAFDGFPASPIVRPGRKSSTDLAGDFLLISPTSHRQPNWRPDLMKHSASKDNIALDTPTSPSLQCIVEEAQADDQPELVLAKPAVAEESAPAVSPKTALAEPALALPEQPAIVVSGPESLVAPAEQPESAAPAPKRPSGIEAVQNPTWFAVFFHFVFVDFLGGVLGWAFRWRRPS